MRRLTILVLVVCAGCEPTELEAGQVVIFAALPITLIGMLFHLGFVRLWRKLDASIEQSFRPSWKIVGLLAVLWVAVLISGVASDTEDWFGFAFWFLGTSYMSVYLIAMRLGVTRKLRPLLAWSVPVPWLLFLPPAIYCAAFGRPDVPVAEWLQVLWIFPGFGGYVASGVFLIVSVDVVVRLMAASRAKQPRLPRAKISGTRSRRGE